MVIHAKYLLLRYHVAWEPRWAPLKKIQIHDSNMILQTKGPTLGATKDAHCRNHQLLVQFLNRIRKFKYYLCKDFASQIPWGMGTMLVAI